MILRCQAQRITSAIRHVLEDTHFAISPHQRTESVRRLRKVEQIENKIAKLIAGASIVSTAGDTPI